MTIHTLWTGSAPLLLASTSHTRRALLESAGIPVDTEAPGVDERALGAEGQRPSDLAMLLATAKAQAVSRRQPSRLVVGADQVLELEGAALHKQDNREGARDQLLRLAGRTHVLQSAGAIARGGDILDVFLDSAALTVRPLAPAAVDLYLDIAGPVVLSSVGCYHVEGIGIHLFENIAGDHSTILGLPLRPLLAILRRLGCLAL